MKTHAMGLDCIIIGHYDMDFKTVERDLKKTEDYSGAYRDLKANSLSFHGERITYMDLLNKIMAKATGHDPQLHVSRLPHLGAAYLASFLRKLNFNVEVINFFNHDKDHLVELLHASPRAVAITTTLYVEHAPIVDIVKFIRQHNSETKIIVGGPRIFNIFSSSGVNIQDYYFREMEADIYVNDSQGELTLSRVLGELSGDRAPDLSGVPNLAYTSDFKSFQRTRRDIENNDLNENSINWGLFSKDYYTPTTQTRTARSCAFKCSFCRYPTIAGPLNLSGIDTVELELRRLYAAGSRNIVFVDDTFNVPLTRFKDMCRMMVRNKFDLNWFSYFRCSNADDEAFDLMEQSGCRGVFLGIESGDPGILKNMNKFANVERYEYGINQLRKRGITTFASIIVGFPGETAQTVKNTMDFLERAAPTFYRAELYYHSTDVPIHKEAEKFGIHSAGYSWKHDSMDWKAACDHVENMYRTVKSSTILPGYMFDFWSMPYLVGKGISIEKLTKFTGIAQEMLLQSFNDPTPDVSDQERRLLHLFSPAQ